MTWHIVGGKRRPGQPGAKFGRVDDHNRGDEKQTSLKGDRNILDKTGTGSRLAHGSRSHDIWSAIRRREVRKCRFLKSMH